MWSARPVPGHINQCTTAWLWRWRIKKEVSSAAPVITDGYPRDHQRWGCGDHHRFSPAPSPAPSSSSATTQSNGAVAECISAVMHVAHLRSSASWDKCQYHVMSCHASYPSYPCPSSPHL